MGLSDIFISKQCKDWKVIGLCNFKPGLYMLSLPVLSVSARCGNQFGNPENGVVVYSDVDSQRRRADFQCASGYQLDGLATLYCTNGVWVPDSAPRCVRSGGFHSPTHLHFTGGAGRSSPTCNGFGSPSRSCTAVAFAVWAIFRSN